MRTGHLGPTVFRSTDLGRSWQEATRPPAFATGDPLQRSLNAVFWLTPGHSRRTRRLVRGRLAAGAVPHRRRRRHVGAGQRLERPQAVGDVVRVAGREHARRLDAPLGDRRSARSRAPLHRPVGWRRVREHRRRRRLAAAQRGMPRDVHSRPGAGVRPRPALRAAASAPTRPALPAEPLRHLPDGTARRPLAPHRRQHAARRRRHRLPDRAAPARSRHRVGLPDGRHRRVAAHEPRRSTRPRTSRATRASRGRGSAPACPNARGSR